MTSEFGLQFHHMGLAVQNDTEAIQFLEGLGYIAGDKVFDPEQNVNLRMCVSSDKPDVEMIMPGEGEGPLTPILKRYNELIYHTCYEVGSLKESLKLIENSGVRVLTIATAKPALLFGGRKVSFYKIMGFGLIELLES